MVTSGCEACPHMEPGSSFDGKHLYCERFRVWTNLLDERWRGTCLADSRGGGQRGQMGLALDDEEGSNDTD